MKIFLATFGIGLLLGQGVSALVGITSPATVPLLIAGTIALVGALMVKS